jgi:hypothetical protein
VVVARRLNERETQMPVLLIPAIIGGTIILVGGGYWLLHLH